MTQEEKLEEAKRLYQTANADQKYVLESLFPELKESEDEKIRKALIKFFTLSDDNADYQCCGVHYKDIVDWLEKQKVLTTEEDLQGKEDVLWCIKQAKKHAKDENEMGTCWFAEKWLEKQGEQKPAEWTADDEEELKIALNTLEEAGQYSSAKWLKNVCLVPQTMQKPACAWSEEDKTVLNNLIYALANDRIGNNRDEYVDWLKNIKNKVQPQPKQEWSEEDYNEIETIACHLDNIDNEGMAEVLRNIRDKYYHIVPQSTWRPSDEQIGVLMQVINGTPVINGTIVYNVMESLLTQLKKLL